MNRRIMKYVINPGRNNIGMPRNASLLHVAVQDNQLCLWATVNPDEPTEVRTFQVEPTGASVEAGRHVYIGTFLVEPNGWVESFAPPHLDVSSWHVFEDIVR